MHDGTHAKFQAQHKAETAHHGHKKINGRIFSDNWFTERHHNNGRDKNRDTYPSSIPKPE